MAPSSLLRGAAAAPGVTTKTLQVKRFVQREPDLLLMNGDGAGDGVHGVPPSVFPLRAAKATPRPPCSALARARCRR